MLPLQISKVLFDRLLLLIYPPGTLRFNNRHKLLPLTSAIKKFRLFRQKDRKYDSPAIRSEKREFLYFF